MILEGISRLVNWASAGTELIGTARNGMEALEFVRAHEPDIVVTDIRMPGMDGLELVAKVKESHPHIRAIMLSGFNEFEYARTAMQHGVKHYLLKPTNEEKILEALRELVRELDREAGEAQYVSNVRERLEKVLPQVKEQFLKEFVTNKTYGYRDWDYYRGLFGFDDVNRPVRIVLFHLDAPFEFEHLFAVKNIAEDLLSGIVLSTTFGDHAIIVVENPEDVSSLLERLKRIGETFAGFYRMETTIAVSDADEMVRARRLYKQAADCLGYRFYLGAGSLITPDDIGMPDHVEEFAYDPEPLCLMIKSGNRAEAMAEIDRYIERLSEQRFDSQRTKSYVIELYLAVVRLSPPEQLPRFMNGLAAFMEADSLTAMRGMFKRTAEEIAGQYDEQNRVKQSGIVGKVLELIETHLHDPNFSLQAVAQHMLYMNADYLGKLFRKETGEKFSNYVMRVRVNKAMETMRANPDIKIFELAERFGFGDNPQYFSQVFKKVSGLTPSEYMRQLSKPGTD
ncbi:response regulator [Paenibacillus thermoaerophilus]|nr:response regulator [Paenibacillus thermoaerophilus]TMV19200.1 response regulator [Paenibacillus thermoaerophilus]